MPSSRATAKTIDMTNVEDQKRSGINPKRVPEGDYLARVFSVKDSPVKSGENQGRFQWLFIIKLEDRPAGSYPYYCQLQENQLWKIRNLLTSAGVNVPRKRLKVDPERIVGKLIAVTMEDDEYEGKIKSVISAIFPPSEMMDNVKDDDDEEEPDEEVEDEDEEEEPEPPKRKAKKKPPPPPEDEDDEEDEDEEEPEADEDEDEEEEEPEPPRRRRAAKKAPAKSAGRKTRRVTDEELEELDIDDI